MSLASPQCLYESVVMQDNPLRYWGLDEASATVDDSGNGGTLTAVGSPGLIASLLTFDAGGTADGGRSFNGTSQSYTAGTTTITGVGTLLNWSIEFWCRFDTVAGAQTIFSSHTLGPQIRRNGTDLEVWQQGSPGTLSSKTTGITLATGTVYHVVVVSSYDRFSADTVGVVTEHFNIFINGVDRRDVGSGGGGWGGTLNLTPRWGSKTGGSEWFDGDLDELAIYDYGLTSDQVLQHYDAGKNGTWGTRFLGATGDGKYPRFVLEIANQTYIYQGLNQRFTDASDLARRVTFFRGGDNAMLNAPKAGTMEFDLNNTNGEFEDVSGARFYNFDLGRSYAEPARAVRLRLWWPDTATPIYPMFHGYLESMEFRRRPGDPEPYVSFKASDILKFLSLAKGDGTSEIDELSSARIVNLLGSPTQTLGSWPRSFETGNATCNAKVSDGDLLALIEEVAGTEGGGSMFFQGRDGKLRFLNSSHRTSANITAVYGGYPDGSSPGSLSNGSFETDLSGWGFFGNADPRSRDSAQAKHGSWSMKITRNVGIAGVLGAASNAVTVASGQVWTASVWVRPGTAPLGQIQVSMEETAGGSSAYGATLVETVSGWSHYSVTQVIAAGVTGIRLIVYHTGTSPADDGETFWLDGAIIFNGYPNLPFRGSEPVHNDADVYTIAEWQNNDSPAITTTQTDADYTLKHGDRVHTRTTLHTSAATLDAAALVFVNQFKESAKKIPTITPRPQAHSSPAQAWATWMAHDFSDKIVHVDTAAADLGTRDLARFIEGIGMDMGLGEIECTLNISPYSAASFVYDGK